MTRLYLSKVDFFSIVPRLRFGTREIEFVWLGRHLSWRKIADDPIHLLKAGKKRFNDHGINQYRPDGFRGGVCADVIPKGLYCYEWTIDPMKFPIDVAREGIRVCPFWDRDLARPYLMNGFCHLINKGDWSGTMLLWDQCKECDHHYDDEEVDDTGVVSSVPE